MDAPTPIPTPTSVRQWFRQMRTVATFRDLDTLLLDGNDGGGYVYCYGEHGVVLWMNAEGWAREQRGERLARTYRDLNRSRTSPRLSSVFAGIVD